MEVLLRNLLLACLFCATAVNGQYDLNEKQIDSLNLVLDKTEISKERHELLRNLWRAHVDRDAHKAKVYAKYMIEVGKSLGDDDILQEGFNRLAIAHSYRGEYDSSVTYYKKSLKLNKQLGKDEYVGVQLANLGMDYNELDQLDSSLYYLETSQKLFETLKDTFRVGLVHRSKSDLYNKMGYYQLALSNALKAANTLETFKDTFELHIAYLDIADVYIKLSDTINSEKYLSKAKDYFNTQKRDRWASTAYLELAIIYFDDPEKRDTAMVYIDQALTLAKKMDNWINLTHATLNKGIFLKRLGNDNEAESILQRALKLSIEHDLESHRSRNHIELAQLFIGRFRIEEALNHARKALALATELNLLEEQSRALKLLADVHRLKNENGEALSFFTEHKKINDSIYNKTRLTQIEELKTIYETEKKEAAIVLQKEEINTLNEKAKVDKLTKGMYAGGMASALAFSGLLVFGFRQRMKRNRIAREKQEEIYKQEIEHKKKELTSQTLHLVQKNTFIKELMENLENIKNSPDKFKTEFRRIVMLLKKENASDKDWEVFKTYFADVHNDFDQKLKTLHADITEKEIRLAAFLRMNLTTKEIAATLNVLPNSILTSKYRLKKKLGLDKETDLNGFLNTL